MAIKSPVLFTFLRAATPFVYLETNFQFSLTKLNQLTVLTYQIGLPKVAKLEKL